MKTSSIVRAVARVVWRRLPQRFQRVIFEAFAGVVRNRKVVADVDGVRFALDLGERIDLLLYVGSFERDVVAAINALCRPGWFVVDVGANIGAHTLRMSERVGKNGKVVAFEPTTFAYEKLLRNVELNEAMNVVAVKAAVADRNSEAEDISVRSSWPTHRPIEVQTSAVPFLRLDDWMPANGFRRVDLIKVDVDGEECAVLRGAVEIIRTNFPIVLLEVGAWHFQQVESNPIALLHEFGYRFWDLANLVEYPSPDGIRSRLPKHDPDKGFSLNVLASRDPSCAETLLGLGRSDMRRLS